MRKLKTYSLVNGKQFSVLATSLIVISSHANYVFIQVIILLAILLHIFTFLAMCDFGIRMHAFYTILALEILVLKSPIWVCNVYLKTEIHYRSRLAWC